MKVSKPKLIQLSLLALSSIIILTSFINFKGFHAKFYNKTGEDLDSLMIAETFIGSLKRNDSTGQIDLKKFKFDGSLPYEQISGNSNNKKLDMLYWSWCGTGRNTISEGYYNFDIKKAFDEKGNPCLYLAKHNEKIFWEDF